jgi:hypothetical protein
VNDLANAPFAWTEIRWEMWPGRVTIRGFCSTVAGVLLLALSAMAQMQIGDKLHMNLNGNVGYTYSGGWNGGVSDHSMGFMGNGVLTGNYYSPNFINFNIDPFYNREQSDTTYGSLTNTSGVTSNVNLFNGSHFPGSFSYNRVFNSTGAFGVPGSDLGLAQHVNTQSIGIGWSALLPGLPTLTANYIIGNTSQQVLGDSGNDQEKDRSLILLSNYRWDGFIMAGQFQHRNTDAVFSQFLLPGEAPIDTQSSSNSFAASIQHAIPMSGNASLSWNRLDYSYNYVDSVSAKNSGNSDTINSNATIHPTNKLGVSFNANYNTSLLGSLPETVLQSGTTVNLTEASTFRSTLVGTDVYYQILKNLGIHADIAHQQQSFAGQTYSATQFGGSANFNFDRTLLKGLSFSLGVVDTAQQQSNTGLGFVGNLNYTRKMLGWDVSGNFSYAQNVQTVMLVYTTSSYSYLASLRRRIGERKYFMAGYSGAHSGISANSGTSSSADRIWTGFIYRGNSFNAYYNKSNGLAIFTPNGLVPVPGNLPPAVLPTEFTSYNSKGWGISGGTTPIRRLTLNFSYAKSNGSTIDPSLSIYTNNTLINAIMQYRIRKIYLNGGYTQLHQSAGQLGTQPLDVTTFYIGFSRWFNFF